MNSSQFKKNEFKKLCAIIGFKRIDVKKLLDEIDTYYNEWIEQKLPAYYSKIISIKECRVGDTRQGRGKIRKKQHDQLMEEAILLQAQ